jgi:Ca2+-binding RTX toxin-like protein
MAMVEGSNFSETLDANDGVTNGADIIFGYGGNDTIFGLGGSDLIEGGAGADDMDGGSGSDTVGYADSFSGVTVSLLTGTGTGGSAEGDTLVSIENIWGSHYNDTLIGDGGDNALSGLNGNDTLKGGGGADNLLGEGGNDTLKGGGGADQLNGGNGIDTVTYIDSPEAVLASLIINGAVGGDAQGDSFSNIENVTGSGYDDVLGGTDGANTLAGLNGDDELKGFGGNDTLQGGSGDDALLGNDGNDSLNGGAGADMLEGGAGNDTYTVDDVDDEVIEHGGEGIDTVLASVSYALQNGADVETLATTNANGTADLWLFGNSSGNNIVGNNGDNVLKGGGGTDQLTGRGGNDIYYVDSADDEIVESAGQGIDEVWTSATYTLTPGADVEVLRTTSDAGLSAIGLTGNSSGNVVRGNNGNNVIAGGDGDDELTGLGGADSFLFNTALNAAGNVDVITDFNVAADTIILENAIFGSLAAGGLSAGQFVIAAAAQDGNDYIIYNDVTGALLYDSDGNGGAAAVQFAELSPGLALTHLDFFVV